MARVIHREWADQRGYAAFLARALPLGAYWTSIDHGRSTSVAHGALRKARGVHPGIPDMIVVWSGITLWIEIKAGSSLSEPQKLTRDRLVAQGHLWALVRSGEELEAALRDAGIPLRATYGERVARLAEIKARKPPKKRGSPVAAGTPRYAVGKAMSARLRKRGILL